MRKSFNDRIYMIGENKCRIKQYTQISYNICWGEAVSQNVHRQLIFEQFILIYRTINLESHSTPRFRTTSVGERQFPKMFTGNESLSNLYLSIEPKTINSVFSGFNLSLFSNIQVWMSLKQTFNW